MTPEQKELTARIRRRAFRATGDKATARQLLRLADEVAAMKFTGPPRALLRQFRSEDPPMPDLDRRPRGPGRPLRREQFYTARSASGQLAFEYDRKTGALAITARSLLGEPVTVEIDEVDARLLRKAFAALEPFKWTPAAEDERRKNR